MIVLLFLLLLFIYSLCPLLISSQCLSPPPILLPFVQLRSSIQFSHLSMPPLLSHIRSWWEIESPPCLCPLLVHFFFTHFRLWIPSKTMTFWGNTIMYLSLLCLCSLNLLKPLAAGNPYCASVRSSCEFLRISLIQNVHLCPNQACRVRECKIALLTIIRK